MERFPNGEDPYPPLTSTILFYTSHIGFINFLAGQLLQSHVVALNLLHHRVSITQDNLYFSLKKLF
jgi:hypothetical protein